MNSKGILLEKLFFYLRCFRWIAIRLEFVGICVTFFAALFAVFGRDYPSWGVSADEIGMSISYSLSITQILNWFVRMTSDLESNVVSVERIKEYSEIPTEVSQFLFTSKLFFKKLISEG